jgi:hypothetical protein
MILGLGNTIPSDSVRQGLGGGGGGGFDNTYSLAFDGVDDYLKASLDGTSTGGVLPASDSDIELTISFWFYMDGSQSLKGIFQWGNSLIDTTPTLLVNTDGASIRTFVDGSYRHTSGITMNAWHHYAITRTASTNTWQGYIDGVSAFTANDGGTLNDRASAIDFYFGVGYNGYLNGKIDEASFWNSVQDVASIYNWGAPNDLSSLNPTLWLRNGDNGSYKSPQWLIPNNSNKDKVSNYSLQFDGVDDEILTSSNFVATGEFTISLWMKPTIFNSNQNILGFGPSGSNWINPSAATNIRVRTSSALLNFPETGGNNLVLNAWNHILIYRDSSNNIGVFVNGATFGATSNNTGSLSLSTIGRGTNKRFAGNLDEIAFWNTNKSSDISSIYSGGTPSDLSSLSPVAYYKMGEEATFVYNVNPEGTWTIPDQAGSSDGTSNNTFLDTGRVGDAPNSTSNAISFNMLETDRKEDTPPTP